MFTKAAAVVSGSPIQAAQHDHAVDHCVSTADMRIWLARVQAWTPAEASAAAMHTHAIENRVHTEWILDRLDRGHSVKSSEALLPPPKLLSGTAYRSQE